MSFWMRALEPLNAILWHDWVLFTLLGVGILFTLWSGLGQYRALTHGVAVIRGRYDAAGDPGAITHFQALSAALSATVGLGNIAGVAIAISLGGPGAVFWMWVTGFVGMALKMTEVTQALLYRTVDERGEPHGGAMWVVSRGLAEISPKLATLGKVVGGVFCITLLVSAFTGGNMFQAWNVADVTREYFGVPSMVTGAIIAVLVGLVILGGIHRIGNVTGMLVPFMCGLYVLAGIVVLVINAERIPEMLALIFRSAFAPTEAVGAFAGGTAGWAFLRGMQRALFSNEAGQGSAPIAHSAAKTDEPVREGVVAGLEPFIDTLCVCTITALVILSSGVWNREADLALRSEMPAAVQLGPSEWSLTRAMLAPAEGLRDGDRVFVIVRGASGDRSGSAHQRVYGELARDDGGWVARFGSFRSLDPPVATGAGLYTEHKGATLTAKAFDRVIPGLGGWLVPIVAWLFAVSTIISWSYYGEQGVVYLFGRRSVRVYRWVYVALVLVACSPLIATEAELDVISTLGTGLMLFANIPIMLIFGPRAMRAYHDYVRRLRSGEMKPRR